MQRLNIMKVNETAYIYIKYNNNDIYLKKILHNQQILHNTYSNQK